MRELWLKETSDYLQGVRTEHPELLPLLEGISDGTMPNLYKLHKRIEGSKGAEHLHYLKGKSLVGLVAHIVKFKEDFIG